MNMNGEWIEVERIVSLWGSESLGPAICNQSLDSGFRTVGKRVIWRGLLQPRDD